MNRRSFFKFSMFAAVGAMLPWRAKAQPAVPDVPVQKPLIGEFRVPLRYTTGVDFSLKGGDLNMTLDDFSERILQPAMREHARRIDEELSRIYTLPDIRQGQTITVRSPYQYTRSAREKYRELAAIFEDVSGSHRQ